jgi:hypothetical protein
MKNQTSSALAKSLTAKGTFPIIVLEINWGSGTVYYTELDYTFNGQACQVAIISIGEFVSSGKIGATGEVSSVSVTLDDTSSAIKAKINTEVIEGTKAKIWHHYYDLPSSDATLMLNGKIAGPIAWSEEERTFSFSVETFQGKGEVGFSPSEYETDPNYVEGLLPEAYNSNWSIIFGSPKRVPISRIYGPTDEEPDLPEKYLVGYNTVSISNVFAKKSCVVGDPDDLFLVDSAYYSVNNESVGGKTVTLVSFPIALSKIEGENWQDDIFVDCTGLSSNIANQIEWILETFTDLTVDPVSFSTAASLVGDTPGHFVLADQEDALSLSEKMAWQARCLLFTKDNVAFLRPLFTNNIIGGALTANEIKLKGAELGFTETEDLVTVFNATWVQDYSGHKEGNQKTVFKNEVDRYGVIPQDYNFFCFTTLRAVQVSASFWAYRYSHSWRKITVQSFLPALGIEAYDGVFVSYPALSAYGLRGFAESVNHNHDSSLIEIKIELGSKAGDHSGGQPIEDPHYWTGGNEPKDGYTSPVPAREEKLVCDSDIDDSINQKLKNAGGTRIHIEDGSIGAYNAYEILWVEKDVFVLEDKETMDVAHVGIPREDNLDSGKVLFTKENTIGYYGWGFPAGDGVWCDYDLNPQNHPNYFNSPTYALGDNVGTEKDKQWLTKARSGFVVTGIEGGRISIGSGSVDKNLEKVKATDAIPAFSPAEHYGYDGDHALIRKPTEDNLPPGRVYFPNTDIPEGAKGKAYNAFDISAYVDGPEPSDLGVELGTQANSFELIEGNTGFLVLGRKGEKNQVRPF